VGYQPWLKDDPESTLIRFNMRDPGTYSHYTDALEKYLEKYSEQNATRVCTGAESNSDIVQDGKLSDGVLEVCVILDSCCFLLYLTYFLISGMPFQPGRLQGEGMQR
jgi:hypothetical protein